jgi:hypothetical protein
MPRSFPLVVTLLFAALLSGCGASPATPEAATPACPEGFFWNGTECEKRRSIVIEEGSPKPTGSPSTDPAPPPPPPPP